MEKNRSCDERYLEYHYLKSRKELNQRIVFRFRNVDDLIEKLSKFIESKGKRGYYVNGNHKEELSLNEIFLKNGKVVEFLNELNDKKDKSILFDLWSKGYEDPIHRYFSKTTFPKISLPGYPFKLQDYWLDIYDNKEDEVLEETTIYNEESPMILEDQKLEVSSQTTVNKDTLEQQVVAFLQKNISDLLDVSIENIAIDEEIGDYGFNSVGLTEFANSLSEYYGIKVLPTIFYNFPTVQKLAAFLIEEHSEVLASKHSVVEIKDKKIAPVVLPKKENNLVVKKGCKKQTCAAQLLAKKGTEPIAIVGMSGRFPGSRNVNEFWENIKQNKDMITEIPKDRWNWEDHYGNTKENPYKTTAKWGGFISDIDKFDPLHFSISPKEAELMDPQHRLAIEEAYHALEDAGINPKSLAGSNTGVFIGSYFDDYATLIDRSRIVDSQIITGLSQSLVANRVSYLFDFTGPSETIDTACSSSLIAIKRGVERIRNGECNVVIAGGVSLVLLPDLLFPLSQAGFLSKEGRCKTFDQSADGYVRGEGVGMVVLKSLSQAQADGDRIYAVIKGVAENHGGKANTLTSPNPQAQKELLMKAYTEAKIDLDQVGYIEAHGTGTPLGDPIETEGLKLAFKKLYQRTNKELPSSPQIKLGSVKTNIGHLEPAAGIAGVIKLIHVLKEGIIPGNPHLKNKNEYLDLDNSPFELQKETTAWKAVNSKPKVAGVSSFGAGGSNAHIVLEEYVSENEEFKSNDESLVVLSARNKKRLTDQVQNLLNYIENISDVNISDISYTLQVGREAMDERLAFVSKNIIELKANLNNYLQGREGSNLYIGNVRTQKNKVTNQSQVLELTKEKRLNSLAELWVKGIDINWKEFYSSTQKPSIISLPTYPFARQRYWIPKIETHNVQAISAQIESANVNKEITLFQDAWEEINLEQKDLPKGTLLLLHTENTDPKLIQKLEESLDSIFIARVDEINKIPFESVSGIIDFGSNSKTNYNWTTIIQKVIEKSTHSKLKFLYISESNQPAIGKGLYQTLGAEYSKIQSISLEIDANESTETILHGILKVVSNSLNDVRIRWKSEKFEIPYLQPITLSKTKKVEGPILITGGTRGLGMAYAKHLVENHQVKKLVLLGRQEFPEKSTWNSITDESLRNKIKDVQFLENKGADVKIISASLVNKQELSNTLLEIKKEWGSIRGLIHCAGLVDTETPAFIRKPVTTITKLHEPKVQGLHNLYEVLKEHSLEFGVLFSSISALVPSLGAGQCDYAMCNAYLEDFALKHYKEGYRSIQWPSWKETGMGEVVDGIYRELGLLSLTNKEGATIIDQVIALQPEDQIPTIAPMVYAKNEFSIENLLKITEKEELQPKVEIQKTDSSSITDWVTLQISEALKLPAEEIELDIPFQEYGVDSILLADLVKQLEKQLGGNVSLSPTIILEHPTVGMLSSYFQDNFSENLSAILNETISSDSKSTAEVQVKEESTSTVKGTSVLKNEPIAIVGMACHFPDANNLGEYWENLIKAKDSIKEVPESRWNINEFYSPVKEPGKSYSKWGGFLENIEDFDPAYFKIPEDLAPQLDPLERQWLEVSAEAIKDAGFDKKEMWGKQVGVYAGSRSGSFKDKLKHLHKDFIVGTGQNFITAHLAHIYNLKGPNMVVDTACSSSLTAIDLAVKDLRLGITEMALAGGVDILLDEGHFVGMSTAEVLSKDGRTKAFDEKADGTGLGEGCGVIVLKRLSDAIANNDQIYAVIDGTSVNNDGSTMGITTPNPKAQQELIESAITNGNIDRSTISYVEAHGTGTLIGDPIELKGITAVLSKNNSNLKCAVGSVKTNIGHLMSAAGIAGVIKVALSISASKLPPTLNCETPNPRFDFDNSPVYPVRELQDWNGVEGIKRAGISAFGLGGNNAHVILSNQGIPNENKITTPFNSTNINFNKKRYWPEESKNVTIEVKKVEESISLNKATTNSDESMSKYFAMTKQKEGAEWVFSTDMENDHYILRDHKVHGVRIVPGVTYLDLIHRCSKELFGKTLSIGRIIFVEPLATDESYNRRVQVRFKKGKHCISEVEVRSRRMDYQGNEYGDWSKHMFCRLKKMEQTSLPTMNIKAFKAECHQQIDMAEVYKSARSVEIVHGEFMETLGTVYQKGREELMELQLSDLSASYLNKFFLSPAFLDGATFSGSSFHAITQNQVSYIPYSIEQFNAYATLPSTIYVYSKHQVEKYDTPSEVLKSDISIYDKGGNLLVEFKNLAIKRIRHTGLITSLLQEAKALIEA